jgi:biopolymer transport protein ExbD
VAEYSAQRVRSKTRAAVKRREEEIDVEEIESGELNLIPYLDMVTNLMLFLLASISAGIILVQIDTQLPDKRPDAPVTQANPPPNPDDQPLGIVVSIYPTKIDLWSASGLEGTLQAPKQTFALTGVVGADCDGPYMCQTNKCDADTSKCVQSDIAAQPVFDYRALNKALVEITARRYEGKKRKIELYQGTLQADGAVPYSTIVSVIAAMRCPLPAFGKEPQACLLPTDDVNLKKATDPVSPDKKVFDPDRVAYSSKTMGVFSDILFSTGLE